MAAPAAPQLLTDEQAEVVQRVVAGRESIYMMGPAGSGKSFVFNRLKLAAPAGSVGSTATTGIAGTHIHGQTIQSFLGLGDGTKAAAAIAFKIMHMPYMKVQRDNCTLTRVLGLDEISMMSAWLWEKIDAVLRIVRKCPHLPMGGMQFLVMGDFAQLPPVYKRGDEDKRLVFESPLWQQMFPPRQCVRLTRIFRQDEQEFIALLDDLRKGDLSVASRATVTKVDRPLPVVHGIEPTTLFSTRDEVEQFNKAKLATLPGVAEVHATVDTILSKDKFAYTPDNMDKIFMAPRSLPLKVGAQLMLIANVDQAKGKVNGSRCTCTVLNGDDTASVMFTDGSTMRLLPQAFEIKDRFGVVIARRVQLPLILAWACTIHKSQGMTLDYVSIDLSKGFAAGQVYTAVSRAKTIAGLQIKGGIPLRTLMVDARVRRYERGEPPLVAEDTPKRKHEEDEAKTSPFFPPAAAAAASSAPQKKARTE